MVSWLRLHPALYYTISTTFQALLKDAQTLVSVHLDASSPSYDWYVGAVGKIAASSPQASFIVFADKEERATSLRQEIEAQIGTISIHSVVGQDPVTVLAFASLLCDHHIVGSSHLGFWGAYLHESSASSQSIVLLSSQLESHVHVKISNAQWTVASSFAGVFFMFAFLMPQPQHRCSRTRSSFSCPSSRLTG